MQSRAFDKIYNWFCGFTESFLTGQEETDRNYILKRDHSMRVCENMARIGKSAGLSETELDLAKITGLVHDTGRFEQFRQYGTFSDKISTDHAALGVRVLENEGALSMLSEENRSMVLAAVRYHNRASLPDEIDDSAVLMCRLVRDADKADIYRVLTDYYEGSGRNTVLELGLGDSPGVSVGVSESLLAGRIVSFEDVKNLNDFKFLQAAWIFDINFPETFSIISEEDYLNRIFASIPAAPETERLKQAILEQAACLQAGMAAAE